MQTSGDLKLIVTPAYRVFYLPVNYACDGCWSRSWNRAASFRDLSSPRNNRWSKYCRRKVPISCAYRKSHSAVFTRRNMFHWAQNRSQYLFARDSLEHLLPLMEADRHGRASRQEYMKFMAAEFDRIGQGEERRIGCQGSHPIEVVGQPFCRQV